MLIPYLLASDELKQNTEIEFLINTFKTLPFKYIRRSQFFLRCSWTVALGPSDIKWTPTRKIVLFWEILSAISISVLVPKICDLYLTNRTQEQFSHNADNLSGINDVAYLIG